MLISLAFGHYKINYMTTKGTIMSFKSNLLGAALLSAVAMGANAGAIPYANIGTEAPGQTFVAANTGDITAYFYTSDAGYDSQIGLWVNGVNTGIYGLWNHGSSYGQALNFGNVNAGDHLTFELKVLSTGGSWFSDASLNGDGFNHAYATNFNGDNVIPTGTYVAFEDIGGGGDRDYNDHQFVFTNVKTAFSVPESSSLGLLGLGLLGLGFARRRAAK